VIILPDGTTINMFEQPTTQNPEKTPEAGAGRFKERAESFVVDILETVKERFDGKLEYHNFEHSKNVVHDAVIIGGIMSQTGLISEHDLGLIKIAAAGHDLVQGKGSGINERESAEELQKLMDKLGGFDPADKEKTREAIMATVAIPKKNAKGLSYIEQSNLNERSSYLALALALADIGTAGHNTEEFLAEGDKLYAEFKLDGKVSRASWDKTQYELAQTFKQGFEEKIGGLPRDTQEELRRYYNSFDTSIAAAKERVEQEEFATAT
jgi:hypothetical protein